MKPQNHVIGTKHRRYAEATKAFVHKRHRTGATGQRCWIQHPREQARHRVQTKLSLQPYGDGNQRNKSRRGDTSNTVGAEITSKRKLR